jgi:hypothetical protein
VGWVAMSERDVQRIRVLSEVLSGRRTEGSAGAVLEITPRQVRRLLVRLRWRRDRASAAWAPVQSQDRARDRILRD